MFAMLNSINGRKDRQSKRLGFFYGFLVALATSATLTIPSKNGVVTTVHCLNTMTFDWVEHTESATPFFLLLKTLKQSKTMNSNTPQIKAAIEQDLFNSLSEFSFATSGSSAINALLLSFQYVLESPNYNRLEEKDQSNLFFEIRSVAELVQNVARFNRLNVSFLSTPNQAN